MGQIAVHAAMLTPVHEASVRTTESKLRSSCVPVDLLLRVSVTYTVSLSWCNSLSPCATPRTMGMDSGESGPILPPKVSSTGPCAHFGDRRQPALPKYRTILPLLAGRKGVSFPKQEGDAKNYTPPCDHGPRLPRCIPEGLDSGRIAPRQPLPGGRYQIRLGIGPSRRWLASPRSASRRQ